MINLPGVEYLWPLVPFGGRLPIVFRRHRREMSSQRHQGRLAILRLCDDASCQVHWRTWSRQLSDERWTILGRKVEKDVDRKEKFGTQKFAAGKFWGE